MSYKAPELRLGGLFDVPVDLWAYGCVLDELAHQRNTFRGESDSAVFANVLNNVGTLTPPRAPLTTRHLYYDVGTLPSFEPRDLI